jgi:hypothetical protein
MFEASVDGEPFDMERWGQYFKPAGMSQNTGDPQKASAPKAAPAPAASDDHDDEPAPRATAPAAPKVEAQESASGGDSRAQDILAMIRNRQK